MISTLHFNRTEAETRTEDELLDVFTRCDEFSYWLSVKEQWAYPNTRPCACVEACVTVFFNRDACESSFLFFSKVTTYTDVVSCSLEERREERMCAIILKSVVRTQDQKPFILDCLEGSLKGVEDSSGIWLEDPINSSWQHVYKLPGVVWTCNNDRLVDLPVFRGMVIRVLDE